MYLGAMSMPLARASSKTLGKRPISNSKPRMSTRVMRFWRHSAITSSTEPRHRKIHRANRDQPPRLLAVEGGKAVGLLGAIGAQNQFQEGRFLLRKLRLLLRFAQVRIHADIVLPLVLTEVENLEGAVVLAFSLKLPLDTDKPLSRSVNRKFPQVACNPSSTEFFCNGCGRS